MKKYSSGYAHNHFGDIIDKASRRPVTITKYGKDAVVVMSASFFSYLQGFKDLREINRSLKRKRTRITVPKNLFHYINETKGGVIYVTGKDGKLRKIRKGV